MKFDSMTGCNGRQRVNDSHDACFVRRALTSMTPQETCESLTHSFLPLILLLTRHAVIQILVLLTFTLFWLLLVWFFHSFSSSIRPCHLAREECKTCASLCVCQFVRTNRRLSSFFSSPDFVNRWSDQGLHVLHVCRWQLMTTVDCTFSSLPIHGGSASWCRSLIASLFTWKSDNELFSLCFSFFCLSICIPSLSLCMLPSFYKRMFRDSWGSGKREKTGWHFVCVWVDDKRRKVTLNDSWSENRSRCLLLEQRVQQNRTENRMRDEGIIWDDETTGTKYIFRPFVFGILNVKRVDPH